MRINSCVLAVLLVWFKEMACKRGQHIFEIQYNDYPYLNKRYKWLYCRKCQSGFNMTHYRQSGMKQTHVGMVRDLYE